MSTHRGLLHHMNINVSNMKRSSRFYDLVFRHLGYDLDDQRDNGEDWKRWELDTPHEISIIQADTTIPDQEVVRGGVGRFNHIAFCALDREDVDRFHREVLVPLESEGLCTMKTRRAIAPSMVTTTTPHFSATPMGFAMSS